MLFRVWKNKQKGVDSSACAVGVIVEQMVEKKDGEIGKGWRREWRKRRAQMTLVMASS